MTIHHQDSRVTLHHGDALDVLRTLPDASVDAVVTDPPYGLEFMGKDWDAPWKASMRDRGKLPGSHATNPTPRPKDYAVAGRPFQQWCEEWAAECLRVLKPGGHLLAFGGTRTWHRLACAVEDAGFEVRDSIAWLMGSGFPKSLNVGKAIDAHLQPGVPRDEVKETPEGDKWRGFGTAMKPGFEPVVVARKPLVGTVAANVTTHSTGALNIDGCRIEHGADVNLDARQRQQQSDGAVQFGSAGLIGKDIPTYAPGGRWPANVILDSEMADVLDEQSGMVRGGTPATRSYRSGQMRDPSAGPQDARTEATSSGYSTDLGGASRFFYVAKAPKRERPVVDGVAHPTVKPLALMRWLVRLVTPPGGTVLEPFAGSGTTVEACLLEGFQCIAIEKGDEYLPLILARIARQSAPLPEAAELVRQPDAARAIAEQVAGQLDIFGEETA